MKVILNKVNDSVISGELRGYTSDNLIPMLEARIEGEFLFSTQIDLKKENESGSYSFVKVMGKDKSTPYK